MDQADERWAELRARVAQGVVDAKRAVRDSMELERKARALRAEALEAVACAKDRVARARARQQPS